MRTMAEEVLRSLERVDPLPSRALVDGVVVVVRLRNRIQPLTPAGTAGTVVRANVATPHDATISNDSNGIVTRYNTFLSLLPPLLPPPRAKTRLGLFRSA